MQHVCMRRIASWSHFPGRAYLKRIGRAGRWALKSMGHGVATPSMASAVADLRDRTRQSQTRPGALHECARCGKEQCSTLVHDASSMCECVPSDQGILAARVVAGVLRRRGAQGIAARRVLRQKGMSQCGWTFVTIRDMLLALEASLKVNVARFSDVTLRQRGGLPVGGALSDLGSGLLLGLQEATWRQMDRLRQAWPPRSTTPSRRSALWTT